MDRPDVYKMPLEASLDHPDVRCDAPGSSGLKAACRAAEVHTEAGQGYPPFTCSSVCKHGILGLGFLAPPPL